METFLKLTNISKSYPSPEGEEKVDVFGEVNLEIPKGSSAAIVGPSGSGKSTLLNLIGTLDKPDGGEVYVDGRPTGKFTEVENSKNDYRNAKKHTTELHFGIKLTPLTLGVSTSKGQQQ